LKKNFPDCKEELKAFKDGYDFVVAAACILDPKTINKKRTKNSWYARVRDSKKTNCFVKKEQ
jgi:hypothetical protein